MVLIYPQGESIFNLTETAQQQHVQKVGAYLGNLKETGFLLDAQPLHPSGIILSGKGVDLSTQEKNEVDIAGFYLLQAADSESAIEKLKQDPRFEDASWMLEVREVLELM